MDYKSILAGLDYTGTPPGGTPTGATQDSRKVIRGTVFVCIKGQGFDGHDFAQKALDAGAGMIVSERPLGLPHEVTVPDTRRAYGEICQNFFDRPADKLKLIGVTGTNGKTTVSSVLKQTLQGMGVECGLIGTIGSEIGAVEVPAKFTTPEAWDMAALLARMVKAGCTHVVMEASSQALVQGRLSGLHFALGIFTNLTRDHLDYHGDMEKYFAAKKLLFGQCDTMLANLDDEWGARLLKECVRVEQKSFSAAGGEAADFAAKNVELRPGGVRFAFLGNGFLQPVKFAIPGGYSVENALAAGAAAVLLGYEPASVAAALGTVPGVKGRCQVLYSGPFTVIRDFAHTGDGMEKLLSSLRPFASQRLVVLFGCAGDRDAAKRPAMGQAAAHYADEIFLTADNPRTEDVEKTMRDALAPIEESGKPCHLQPDREQAVDMALDTLHEGDMLVLCGKGHEDYQVMDGWTQYLDESVLVRRWAQAHAF